MFFKILVVVDLILSQTVTGKQAFLLFQFPIAFLTLKVLVIDENSLNKMRYRENNFFICGKVYGYFCPRLTEDCKRLFPGVPAMTFPLSASIFCCYHYSPLCFYSIMVLGTEDCMTVLYWLWKIGILPLYGIFFHTSGVAETLWWRSRPIQGEGDWCLPLKIPVGLVL